MKTLNTVAYVVACIIAVVAVVLGNIGLSNYDSTFSQGCYKTGPIDVELCHNGVDIASTYVEEDIRYRMSVATTPLTEAKAEVDAEVKRVLDAIKNAPSYQANNCITAVRAEPSVGAVYVSFAPCHGEGGVGVIYNIDAKFWSAEVAAQFSK